MAPSYSKYEKNGAKTRQNAHPPPMGFTKIIKELKKGEYVDIKCRTNPNDPASTTYTIYVQLFSTGTCEDWIRWLVNFRRACIGQNATTGPARFASARRLLEGGALTAFENAALNEATETVLSLDAVFKKVTEHVFPPKSLQKQKRFMRRFLRKPQDIKIKNYVERVVELNELLTEFPDPSATLAAAKLPDDELLDLLEFGVPRDWQDQMLLHGFDPVDSTPEQFVHFCERIEATEVNPKKETKSANGKDPNGQRSNWKRARSNEDKPNSYNCMMHGWNATHNTEQCNTMKQTVAKQKAADGEKTVHWKGKNYDKSKTTGWKKPKNTEELNALITFVNKQKAEAKLKKHPKRMEEVNNFGEMTISDEECHTSEIDMVDSDE